MTTSIYPIVFEAEESGAVSAYMPGLPVYAAADTRRQAERAISRVLSEYLAEHPNASSVRASAEIKVARVRFLARRPPRLAIVGAGALLGRRTSAAKAAAARANGRKGGRPRTRAASTK